MAYSRPQPIKNKYELDEIKEFLLAPIPKEFSLTSKRLNKTFLFKLIESKTHYNRMEYGTSERDYLGMIHKDTLMLSRKPVFVEQKMLDYFLCVVNGILPWPDTMIFTPTNPPIATLCKVCGRPLTDPESIAKGIGPTCEHREEEPDYFIEFIF